MLLPIASYASYDFDTYNNDRTATAMQEQYAVFRIDNLNATEDDVDTSVLVEETATLTDQLTDESTTMSTGTIVETRKTTTDAYHYAPMVEDEGTTLAVTYHEQLASASEHVGQQDIVVNSGAKSVAAMAEKTETFKDFKADAKMAAVSSAGMAMMASSSTAITEGFGDDLTGKCGFSVTFAVVIRTDGISFA